MEVVLAVRHSLSAPIWLKPSTMELRHSSGRGFSAAEQATNRAAVAAASVIRMKLFIVPLEVVGSSPECANAAEA